MLTTKEKLEVLLQDKSARAATTYAAHTDRIVDQGRRFSAPAVDYPQRPAYWANADNAVMPPLGVDINWVGDMTTVSGEPPSSAQKSVDTPIEDSATVSPEK
jgi:hypothetical protein